MTSGWTSNSPATPYAKDRKAWKDGKPTVIPGNGFARAMVKVGQRIYIDEPALLEWLEDGQQ